MGRRLVEDLNFSKSCKIHVIMDNQGSISPIALDERILGFLELLEKPQKDSINLLRTQVSSFERAEQLALQIARKHSFQEGLQELLEALQISRHPKTQKALHDLLFDNITPAELSLVLELRTMWREYPEFSVAIGNHYSTGSARREHLSYRLALRLIRHFSYFPSCDDVIFLVQDSLEFWRDDEDLLRRFKVFQDYLSFSVANPELLTLELEVMKSLGKDDD
jgi:hypothetical protein